MKKKITNWFLSIIVLALLVSTLALSVSAPTVQANPDSIDSWAIIVVGYDGYETWYNASMEAYDTLLNIGYTDDSIKYLDVINRTDSPFDGFATEENVNSSMTNWLADNSDGNDICVIFFNSHGWWDEDGYVALNNTNYHYSKMKQCLQSVEYGRLIIVVDACFSETCIDNLSATDRIVISSASSTEHCMISLFTRNFWPKTETNNLTKAFNNAANETWQMSQMAPWGPHKPKLDDNGDGSGHWDENNDLPFGDDGYLANVTYLNKNEMVNLAVYADGAGGTLTGVEVKINDYIIRYTTLNIILTKGSYTIETQSSVTIGSDTWRFWKWEDDSTSNPRSLPLTADKTVTAYYKRWGGCPYVYTWNGSVYILDNNILGMSEVSNGTDVEDFYRLEQAMVPFYTGTHFSVYSLMLGEFENEHSYIDKVRLYAVDHDPNVNVAVTPDGQILTYSDPNPPISAIDNYGIDWLSSLLEPDDTYYRGFPEDYLLLDFGTLDVSEAAKLVLRANDEFKKDLCIHVQTQNEAGEWTDVAVFRTRNYWSTMIVDLAEYLPNPDGTLKIRLYFAGVHRIDYVGLDTTPEANVKIKYAYFLSAVHSTEGNVKRLLRRNDNIYAELAPGEQIELKFILPNNQQEEARTFITYMEGRYETINN